MGSQTLDGKSGEGSESGLEGGKLVRAGAFEAQDSAGVTLHLLGVGLVRPVASVDPEKQSYDFAKLPLTRLIFTNFCQTQNQSKNSIF